MRGVVVGVPDGKGVAGILTAPQRRKGENSTPRRKGAKRNLKIKIQHSKPATGSN
jgi:hypothetical protein